MCPHVGGPSGPSETTVGQGLLRWAGSGGKRIQTPVDPGSLLSLRDFRVAGGRKSLLSESNTSTLLSPVTGSSD